MSSVLCHIARSVVVGCTMDLLCAALLHAQSPTFIKACQNWIDKKGYSTDYIEQKTGKRQPGLASEWRGNVPVEDLRPGDVILIRLSATGAMHAALADEVRRNADGTVSEIRLSEWNWGKMTDQRCLITENFGKLSSTRWINRDAVAYVWRPSLPLPK
ncbi:MAG TPA: hypothetical protein VMO00_10340 [Methylomirabilota bacterium]|nr:hypothetical protein [Methylomirabilota bacterium]